MKNIIEKLAYKKWLKAGKVGDDKVFWREAEQEIENLKWAMEKLIAAIRAAEDKGVPMPNIQRASVEHGAKLMIAAIVDLL